MPEIVTVEQVNRAGFAAADKQVRMRGAARRIGQQQEAGGADVQIGRR